MAVGGAMVDPYATLNVPTTAPTAAIRSSYKRLMLQCHPDKVHDEALRAEKAAQFEKVQEAYELLIDPRRRRKYDEEMQRSGSAAAATASAGPGPAPPTARRSASGPMGAGSTEDEQTRERERAARHERRRRKAEERGSKGEAGFNTQEEQNARQETRRYAAQQEEANRMAREAKYAQANAEARRQEEARARKSSHTSARYAHGTGSSVDDTGTSPRKSSTFAPPPSSYPKPQPAPPPPPREPKVTSQAPQQPAEAKVRAGYEEKLREEKERLNAAKAKMASELGSGGHSPHAGHSSRPSQDDFFAQQQQHATAARAAEMQRQAAAQAEMLRQAEEGDRIRMEQVRLASERASRLEEEKRQQREQRAREKALKKERERAQHESERRQPLFRNADMPSPSPPNRRSSHSTASRDDSSFPSTPQNRTKDFHIPSSAPFGPTTPVQNLRRRHSISESPSLEKQQEKQQARMQRERAAGPTTPAAPYGQTGNCDSGYSSPSPDTSTSTPEKKMMPQNPIVRNGADGTPGSAPWKKYTFEVYVREDEANPANTPPHPHNRRKQSSAGSPSVHPAEIPHMSAHSAGPPLPPDFFTKTTGISGTPYIYPIHNAAHHASSSVGGVPIDHQFAPGSPGSQYTTSRGPASHTSSTGSTSSPRMGRQHSHRHEHHYSSSPKSSSDTFTPHAGSTGPIPMPRSSTYSHPPSSGSRQRTDIYSAPGTFPTHPASFNRSGTWG